MSHHNWVERVYAENDVAEESVVTVTRRDEVVLFDTVQMLRIPYRKALEVIVFLLP